MFKKALLFITFLTFLAVLAPPQSAAAQGGCGDRYEPNDDGAQAKVLQPGQLQGAICPAGEWDIFKLNVSAGDSIYLSLFNLPADYDLSLYSNAAEDWVANSDIGQTADEQISWTSDKQDTLYVVIYGYAGATSSKPYTLALMGSDTVAQLAEIRARMSAEDSARFLEFMRYAYDTAKCVRAVHSWQAAGVITAGAGDAAACGGMINEMVKVLGKYISPDGVYGDRGDIGSMDLNGYCAYKYGSGAKAVRGDRGDAYSWSCQRGGSYVGGLDMGEVCRRQFSDLPRVVMGNRWDANSWRCVQ